jgi:hypothetical protein
MINNRGMPEQISRRDFLGMTLPGFAGQPWLQNVSPGGGDLALVNGRIVYDARAIKM